MRAMLRSFGAFVGDESGASAIEYALIAALVSVAGVVALTQTGESLESMFTTVAGHLANAVQNGTS